MLKSVLYVSRSTLAREEAGTALAELVAKARARNAALGISGALIFTGHRFAQWLEGPAEAVDRLMADITADDRHTDVTVVDSRPIEQRSFNGWGLIYSGGSFYVDRHLKALLGDSPGVDDCQAVARLRELMTRLDQ